MPLYFDKSVARYRGADGQFVGRSSVIAARDAIVREIAKTVDTLTLQLKAREITLQQWQYGIKDAIRAGHTLAFGIASGGKANVTQSEWGKLGAMVKDEYAMLNRMAAKIEAGGIIHRGHASQLAKAIRSTFITGERFKQMEIGKTKAIWTRTAKESCADCIASEGEWNIDEVPAIGSTVCRHNCKCFFTFA